MVEDITERKRSEQELVELSSQLEKRVALRTAELTAANKELDSFAYAVSHDLRAPLRALNGFSSALIEDFSEKLDGDARVYLEQIGIASHKMGELIDALLTLSRSTRGEMQRTEVDLSQLFRTRANQLSKESPERKVEIDIQPEMKVRGDVAMLTSAMDNILDNAWKYTGTRDVARISVYSKTINHVEHFYVDDNGVGFDMHYANRLFEPFHRLHRQDEFPGTGIGLATVRRIIHRHGGQITALSQLDRGTRIIFTIGDFLQEGASGLSGNTDC